MSIKTASIISSVVTALLVLAVVILRALASYERAGFAPYVLDPEAGHALFLQKILTESPT